MVDCNSRSFRFVDDPKRDFRRRYRLPEHFLWDPNELPAISYEGYVSSALGLLPNPPCSVLDVGCGDGWVAAKLVERGYAVTGIDYSERAIAFARIIVPKAQFHLIDIRELGHASDYHHRFDAVCCIEVLEHVPPAYHDEVLRGIKYSLKPEGLLVIAVPSVYRRLNRWHYKHFERSELEDMLRHSGFRVTKTLNQFRLCWITSSKFWRLVKNRFYDITLMRKWLRRFILNHYNLTEHQSQAGRYIVQAVKV
jgi:2-polyprenyl-3-methyl-5-hydroxy-6-metoxy-1,4-benzoquinol methylase